MTIVVGAGVLPSSAQSTTTTTTTTTAPESTTTTAAPTTAAPTTAAPTTAAPTTAAPTTAAPTSATTATTSASSTTLSAEEQAEKDRARGNLHAARAADADIRAALDQINADAQTTKSKIDKVQALLEAAKETQETARSELVESGSEQTKLEAQLRAKAVEGFTAGVNEPGLFFSDKGINDSIRQTQLLQQANKSTAELLEDLRTLYEDQQLAQAEAAQAVRDAEVLEQQLVEELEKLGSQQTIQLGLKAEAEARIARWAADLTAYAAEDESIRDLIKDSGGTPIAVPQPAEPSSLGYQWPVQGRVSSPYGYRIHPVFGTRKLHSGLDVAAPRGAPIAATSGGVVIYTGYRGGYGNTVIVDHGAGFTSLYAHMSTIGVSNGAEVDRGDIVGLVGATGTATGNHLHFEIRVNGTAVDPAPYLP
ncbi:MAG: peptidoglycan DD-metalloendopeptidase family protein [Actinomycetota bacterium]